MNKSPKKLVSLFEVSLLLLSIFILYIPEERSASPEYSGRGSEEGVWQMFRGNPEHNGRTPYSTADNPGKMQWRFKTDGAVRSSPAIGLESTIYVGSDDGNLYAINKNGSLRWKFETEGPVQSSPAIGPEGTIYVGSDDGHLYAINPNGTLRWSFETGNSVWSSPVIGSDGVIYVGSDDGHLYAIRPDGTLKWKFAANDTVRSSPAIDKGGRIIFGSDGVYAVNPNGTLAWKFSTGTGVQSSPAIAVDGTIYVGSNSKLYAINPNGTLRWRFSTGDFITSSPAISAEGTVYIGSRDNSIYAINSEGALKWRFSTGSSIWWSSPAISAEGTVYVGTYSGKMYALNPDGSLRWSFDTGQAIWSSPAIGMNGAVYFGSGNSYIYSLWKSAPTPPQHLRVSIGEGYVNLSWQPPEDDGGSPVVEYRIYRGKISGAEAYLCSVLPSETTYQDAVSNERAYYYHLTAVNDIGESGKSNEARANMVGPPFPPKNLRVKLENGYANLTWAPPDEDGGSPVIEYRIYRGSGKGAESYLASVNGSTTRYLDYSVKSGNTYYYTVKAVNEVGESTSGEHVRVDLKKEPNILAIGLLTVLGLSLVVLVIKKRKSFLSILSKR